MGMSQSFQSKMETQREKLQEIMESKFGLLTILLNRHSINRDEKEKIDAQESTSDKNKMLLQIIVEKGQVREFIDALQDSGQIHVINWIRGNGVYNCMFDLDWPLTNRENYIVTGCYELLRDILGIEFNSFIGVLNTKNILNKSQIEYIKSKATICERVQAFIGILRRFSLKSYFLMIELLRDSNQSHIANILEDVTVPVQAHLEERNSDELEKQLVREVVKFCLDNKTSIAWQADVNLSLTELCQNIIAARQGEGTVLYVRCSNIQEFHHLCTMVDNDEMSQIIEQLFYILLKNIKANILSVIFLEPDRKRAEKAFHYESFQDKTLDKHLRRLRSQLKNDEPTKTSASEEQATNNEKQKKTDSEAENHTNCIRRLYNSLLSSLTRIPEIVAEMYQKEKLSDSELERLLSYEDSPVKASKELLCLLINNTVEVYESFLESLRSTKQEHIYLLLTSSPDELETDLNTISDHSILIRRNFSFLVESLDFENNILERLYEKDVLSQREYEQISNKRDRFRKSEALLSLISRKSDNDFTEFKDALQHSNLRWILEELHICVSEKQSEPTIALAEDKHEKEPIPWGTDINAPEKTERNGSPVEIELTPLILIKSLSKAEDSSVVDLIQHDKAVNRLLTKFYSIHDDLQKEIFIKKTMLQKQLEKSNEQMHFDEKQVHMEQQLAESRMQREAEKYAFHNACMDLKKEKDSYEKSRVESEKEKEELIRSLHVSQTDLKKEKDSYEKSRMDWEKEKEELIRSLHVSQTDLKKEKNSYETSRINSEKEKEDLIRSLSKPEEVDLLPLPGYVTITETEPDMLGLDDSRRQAKMPCGHVIGRDSMTEYCRHVVQKGQFQFFCPSSGPPPCNAQWEYFIVRHVARFTTDELRELEKKISENYLMKARGMQRCPGCQTYCYRREGVGAVVRCPICTKNSGANFDFCWWCQWKSSCKQPCGNPGCDGKDQRLSILAFCPTKIINQCKNCPSIRGCPKCGILIEFKGKCTHMKCENCHDYEFCFICLKGKKNGKWRCSPWSGTCVLQPRQTTLPGS